MLGDYEPDRYKSDKKDVKVVDQFTVAAPGGGAELNAGGGARPHHRGVAKLCA